MSWLNGNFHNVTGQGTGGSTGDGSGDSGTTLVTAVHIGESPPTDPRILLWFDSRPDQQFLKVRFNGQWIGSTAQANAPTPKLIVDKIPLQQGKALLSKPPSGTSINNSALLHTPQGIEEHTIQITQQDGQHYAALADTSLAGTTDGWMITVTYLSAQ